MSIQGIDVKKELVRIFKREMTVRTIQVRVITRDPLDRTELPCIAINQILGDEGVMGFNNYLTEEFNATLGQDSQVYAGLFTENFELRLWTENDDERDDMALVMIEIALLAKQELILKGLGNMKISGVRDEQDYKSFEPYLIHWKTLNFMCLNQYDVKANTPVSIGEITDVEVTPTVDPINNIDD